MTEERLRQYYDTILAIWRLMKKDLETVESIKDPRDPRWAEIEARYDEFEKKAPAELKRWAGEMASSTLMQVENVWRTKNGGKSTAGSWGLPADKEL